MSTYHVAGCNCNACLGIVESYSGQRLAPNDIIGDLMRDAKRYRWIRERGAWETEAFLNGLTPEEYDAAVDAAIREGGAPIANESDK